MPGRVLFDTNFLSALADRDAPVRARPAGVGGTVEARFSHLLLELDLAQVEVIVPAPALAEALCRSDASPNAVLPLLEDMSRVRIAAFDERAAIEFGEMFRGRTGETGPTTTGKVKFKFDLMILAIAKVEAVSTIYTDDEELQRRARAAGMKAVGFWELDLPRQQSLPV